MHIVGPELEKTKMRPPTEVERAMFREGYVSARLAAAKFSIHRATVTRYYRDKLVAGILAHKICFVSVKDLVKYVGPNIAKVFKADDWSDIFGAP